MANDSAGGFLGDPAEAFDPPAAGGCCGGTQTVTADESATSIGAGCCGTAVVEPAGSTGCCG